MKYSRRHNKRFYENCLDQFNPDKCRMIVYNSINGINNMALFWGISWNKAHDYNIKFCINLSSFWENTHMNNKKICLLWKMTKSRGSLKDEWNELKNSMRCFQDDSI
jgi:hypothetical protein